MTIWNYFGLIGGLAVINQSSSATTVLEAELEDHNNLFLQSIYKKRYLLFYWEEIYDLLNKILLTSGI